MTNHKSEDYKISAVQYYLENNTSYVKHVKYSSVQKEVLNVG